MMIRTIVTGYVCVLVSGTVAAQGAFNFDDIPGVNEEPAVVIDLNPVLMEFVRGAISQADPEGADLLRGLRSIKLRVYHDAADNARQFNNFIDDVSDVLGNEGWMPVVSTQDEQSKVRIYMQMTGQEISGMTAMLTDGREAIFINIDGSISAEDLGAVLAQLPYDDVLGALDIPPISPNRLPATPTNGVTQ